MAANRCPPAESEIPCLILPRRATAPTGDPPPLDWWCGKMDPRRGLQGGAPDRTDRRQTGPVDWCTRKRTQNWPPRRASDRTAGRITPRRLVQPQE